MSQFEFTAQISAVKPTIAKVGTYGESASGALEITLKVKQPAAPPEPRLPYDLSTGRNPNEIKPRPTKSALKQEKDETLEAFHERRAADLEQQQRNYDLSLEAHRERVAEWRQEMANHSPRLLAYAQLIGLSSVFGGQEVSCVLTPLMQDLLPGFSASLMELPAGPAAAEPLFAEA